MKTRKLATLLPCWLLAGADPTGQPHPQVNALHRPGETTLLAFKTDGGKTVTLCEGLKGAYLVYRFGKPTKVELQYPAVLDAGSWKKFTFHQSVWGRGVVNGGGERYRLTFATGKTKYELYDAKSVGSSPIDGNDIQQREVGVTVYAPADKIAVIVGQAAGVTGGLLLSEAQRQRVW